MLTRRATLQSLAATLTALALPTFAPVPVWGHATLAVPALDQVNYRRAMLQFQRDLARFMDGYDDEVPPIEPFHLMPPSLIDLTDPPLTHYFVDGFDEVNIANLRDFLEGHKLLQPPSPLGLASVAVDYTTNTATINFTHPTIGATALTITIKPVDLAATSSA